MTLLKTTRPRRKALVGVLILMATAAILAPPLAGQDGDHNREPVDLQAIYRIKEEGFGRSRVMDIASYLTDVHGPRLTGSPNIRAAAEWAVKEMKAWGLANATLATWGPFGRGWTNDRYVGQMIAPSRSAIIAYPKAWTPGTEGAVVADAVRAALTNDADLNAQRGKLKGKFVLTEPERAVSAHFEADARRFSDSDLA
jgi:hypothetical protein